MKTFKHGDSGIKARLRGMKGAGETVYYIPSENRYIVCFSITHTCTGLYTLDELNSSFVPDPPDHEVIGFVNQKVWTSGTIPHSGEIQGPYSTLESAKDSKEDHEKMGMRFYATYRMSRHLTDKTIEIKAGDIVLSKMKEGE